MSILKSLKKKSESVPTPAGPAPHADGKPVGPRGVRAARAVLKRPHVSERAHAQAAQRKYFFWVTDEATKPMIRQEVHIRYGVDVADVNIIRSREKAKRYRNRESHRRQVKKAIVTLREGQQIEIA